MATFTSFDGVELHYFDEGDGSPVLLLHGFACSAQMNWKQPAVFDAVVERGYRVIAPDARGHGESAKPHDPESYSDNAMVRDVSALLDHLGLDGADIVGYSMGAIVGLGLATYEPRTRSLVVGGVGHNLTRTRLDRDGIASALEGGSSEASKTAKAFRSFAESTGADLTSLAAIQRAKRVHRFDLAAIDLPVLVVVGERDTVAGSPDGLAGEIKGARGLTVPGDHLSAFGKPGLRDAIVEFLAAQH